MNIYNEKQKELLQLARYEHLPLSKYVSDSFTENEMLVVLDGLRDSCNVENFANIKFNYLQMIELLEFIKSDYDISSWISPDITYLELSIIHKFVEDGFNPKPFIDKRLGARQLNEILKILKSSNSDELINKAKEFDYNCCIMRRLRKYPDDIIPSDFDLYGLYDEFDTNQMTLIESMVLDVPDIVNYIYPQMSESALNEVYLGLLNHIDVRTYALPCYNAQQMKLLRECLSKHIDITNISKPDLSVEEMEDRLK